MARSHLILLASLLLVLFAREARAGLYFSFDDPVPLSADLVFSTDPSIEDEGHPSVFLDTVSWKPNVYDRYPSLQINKDADDVCLYVGALGGCSACEYDTLGACAWVSDADFQLKGACVSKDTAEVITNAAQSIRMVWPLSLGKNGAIRIEGSNPYLASVFASVALELAVETFNLSQAELDFLAKDFDENLEAAMYNLVTMITRPVSGGYLCPAPDSGEPELSLAAPSFLPAASKSYSKYASGGYCMMKGSDLPAAEQTLHYEDRFSAFAVTKSMFDVQIDQCASINSRNALRPTSVDIAYGSQEPLSGEDLETIIFPRWKCDPELGEIPLSPYDRRCLALVKEIECNIYCNPYGTIAPTELCPSTILKITDACGHLVDPRAVVACDTSFSIGTLFSRFETEEVFAYLVGYAQTGVLPDDDGECFDLDVDSHYEVNADALFLDMGAKLTDEADLDAVHPCTGLTYNFAFANCWEYILNDIFLD